MTPSKSVLAIDDSRTIRGLVSTVLEARGYRVVTAENGRKGINKFAGDDFDAVITDINMPVLDGFGVIRNIREGKHNKRVPILVLSTESSDDFKSRARDLGATGWIIKPFDDVALGETVDLVTGQG